MLMEARDLAPPIVSTLLYLWCLSWIFSPSLPKEAARSQSLASGQSWLQRSCVTRLLSSDNVISRFSRETLPTWFPHLKARFLGEKCDWFRSPGRLIAVCRRMWFPFDSISKGQQKRVVSVKKLV